MAKVPLPPGPTPLKKNLAAGYSLPEAVAKATEKSPAPAKPR